MGRCLASLAVAAAVLATVLVRPSGLWQLGLIALLWCAIAGEWVLHVKRGVQSFSHRDGQWQLMARGRSQSAELKSHHFFSRRVGVLTFELTSGSVYRVSLMPDSLSEESYRRLILALRA